MSDYAEDGARDGDCSVTKTMLHWRQLPGDAAGIELCAQQVPSVVFSVALRIGIVVGGMERR